jgi:hypothetical protein
MENVMRSNKVMGISLCLGIVLGVPHFGHAAPVFGSNLIQNSDAEAGAGSPTGLTVVPVPNWTTVGNFTVVPYGIGGGFPSNTDPGPVARGANFFAGGPSNASSSAAQIIDVSMGAASIDLGGVTFNLAGYLGGFAGQDDNAVLTATFVSASNLTLGTASIGPVTQPDRSGLTGMLLRSTAGAVPVGTREI